MLYVPSTILFETMLSMIPDPRCILWRFIDFCYGYRKVNRPHGHCVKPSIFRYNTAEQLRPLLDIRVLECLILKLSSIVSHLVTLLFKHLKRRPHLSPLRVIQRSQVFSSCQSWWSMGFYWAEKECIGSIDCGYHVPRSIYSIPSRLLIAGILFGKHHI